MKLYSENKLKATLSKSRHQYDIACDMVKLIEQGKLLYLLSFRPNTHVSSKTHYFTLLLEPNNRGFIASDNGCPPRLTCINYKLIEN